MREAELWIEGDATAARDPKLQEDVRNAALVRETQEAAFSLLEKRMGTAGIDILYDVAYGTTGKLYPLAAVRAKRSLDDPDVRDHASAALSVLLDFRDAKGCEAKHGFLERARDQGDARMLPILQPLVAPRGCGFFGRGDCNPCMHRDHLLTDAIAAIIARSQSSP
jgi:serine/threonine-protein kinase